jgi:hypothetical protein
VSSTRSHTEVGAAQLTRAAPNNALQLTAYSLCSFVAPAFGSS